MAKHPPHERVLQAHWEKVMSLPPARRRWLGPLTDLYFLAASRRRVVRFRGTDIRLEKGELLASVRALSKRWGTTKYDAGAFLDWAEREGIIEKPGHSIGQSAGQLPGHVTVCHLKAKPKASDSQPDTDSDTDSDTIPVSTIPVSTIPVPPAPPQDSAPPSNNGTEASSAPPTARQVENEKRTKVRAWWCGLLKANLDADYQQQAGDWTAFGKIATGDLGTPQELAAVHAWLSAHNFEGNRRRALHVREFAAHAKESRVLMRSAPEPRNQGRNHPPFRPCDITPD